LALRDSLMQVSIGCRDHSDIGLGGLYTAETSKLAFLEHAEILPAQRVSSR
jgi:hypothetical protein